MLTEEVAWLPIFAPVRFRVAGAKRVQLMQIGKDKLAVVEIAPLNPRGSSDRMSGGEIEPFGFGLAIECLIGGFGGQIFALR